ncbi:MAG: histone deacetylase 11, partial [Mariniblastus sp.]
MKKSKSRTHQKSTFSWVRVVKTSCLIPVVLMAIWVGFINLPKPEVVASVYQGRTLNRSLQTVGNQEFQSGSQDDQATKPSPAELPFNVSVVYTPAYLIDLGGLEKLHPFDIKKYQKIYDQLVQDKLIDEVKTFVPAELTRQELLLVHDQAYLDDLKNRKNVANYLEAPVLQYAPVSLDKAVLRPFKRASGGTVLAARLALDVGIGINLGGGYHHAKPDRGEGFCLFADVPIAIRILQKERKIKRAVIIDVDVHQGNGTIKCLEADDTTFTFSMHQGNIYPIPKEVGDRDVELRAGMGDTEYLKILQKHLGEVLDLSKADICFIVGGCDPLKGDPLANLEMTDAGIARRDHMIVEACVQRKIPVVLTLSGGYRKDAWKAQHLSVKNLINSYKLSDVRPGQTESKKKLQAKTRDH